MFPQATWTPYITIQSRLSSTQIEDGMRAIVKQYPAGLKPGNVEKFVIFQQIAKISKKFVGEPGWQRCLSENFISKYQIDSQRKLFCVAHNRA